MKKIGVVMAGGKGTRLYPISTEEKPKQFLKLLSNKPMVLETMERLEPLFTKDEMVISTLIRYLDYVMDYPVKKLYEPTGKGTAITTLLLVYRVLQDYGDAVICLIPADHHIEGLQKYHRALGLAIKVAEFGDLISMIGIHPNRPETDYGYIYHERGHVKHFVEKPNKEQAKRMLDEQYLWNSGIFVFRASVMFQAFKDHLPDLTKKMDFLADDYLEAFYRISPNLNIEKAIIEKCSNLYVVESNFVWDDIGSLDRLTKITDKNVFETGG